ncbi:MAG: STAS domain-containing protein [Selenomonadaceae bacterium]|nr:STAS domain-containing protein [Selenomonadaceae bacterium]MBR6889187.1 STAS domain-containing protein [Selenomonadaceae bacterium]
MSTEIDFKNTTHNDWKVISIIGRLDTVTAADAEQNLKTVLQENDKVAIDMTSLDYISSAGLRVLLRLAKQAKRVKKNFVLFGASGMIKEVLEASGMDMLVKIYETQEDLP